MTLYKNGVQVDQATDIEGPVESLKTYLGRYGNGAYWIGAIDEAGIWDRALSSMEIEQLYNIGNGIIARKTNIQDQDLMLEAKGYWKINEGIGELLSDASGHGNTGAINGASWSTCDSCGCIDSDACNYDGTVTIDNGSCVYVQDPCEICEDGVILSNDFDSDGVREVFWRTSDNSAYLRALMHADGNIRYANYQNEQQMTQYLTDNGFEGYPIRKDFPLTAQNEDR